jgi:drug/metabolite transporter (DMT)-like permease
LSPIAWLNIAYLGVFCSALGYWFYITSLDILGPGGASVFINLIPVISVIAGFAVLGDRLTAGQWVGALVAIAGVWLATTPARRSRGPAIAA